VLRNLFRAWSIVVAPTPGGDSAHAEVHDDLPVVVDVPPSVTACPIEERGVDRAIIGVDTRLPLAIEEERL
jgi:hypothetical protein